MRALLLIHRYLGIAGGALMTSWCLSGFVMMYVAYPALSETRRMASLQPLAWSACPGAPKALPDDPSAAFRIEMLGGRLVLAQDGSPRATLKDLCSGARITRVSASDAEAVATAYLGGKAALSSSLIESDQWTVSGQFAAERPLYRFVARDELHTELYVSSVSGRLVQVTTGRQRFWNWLGAIPHWLYLFELRRHPAHWTALVIGGSLLGGWLTLTGLGLGFLGVRGVLRRASHSARRGHAWHHLSGLVFGGFTLSWLASGLLSMQPYGLLESKPLDRHRVQGQPPSLRALASALQALSVSLSGNAFVSLEAQPSNGFPCFVAHAADGGSERLNATGQSAPLTTRDWLMLAEQLGSPPPALLTHEDSYWFAHHDQEVSLPAYRFTLPDTAGHTLYFDARTGALEAQLDRNARAYRWIDGLHRVDLLPAVRRRPFWDLLVLPLLGGVSVVCVTGAWLGYRGLFVRQR